MHSRPNSAAFFHQKNNNLQYISKRKHSIARPKAFSSNGDSLLEFVNNQSLDFFPKYQAKTINTSKYEEQEDKIVDSIINSYLTEPQQESKIDNVKSKNILGEIANDYLLYLPFLNEPKDHPAYKTKRSSFYYKERESTENIIRDIAHDYITYLPFLKIEKK